MHSSSGWATTNSVRPRSCRSKLTNLQMHVKAIRFCVLRAIYCPKMHLLQPDIERLFALGPDAHRDPRALELFLELREALTRGEIRAAEKVDGRWTANAWVKQGILLGFRLGEMIEMGAAGAFTFVDKDTYPARPFAKSDGVRVVPGGSTARLGAYVAKGVICMPPMFINVGAYVDEGTMVDSHALVGSCAQIGKRV